MGRGGTIFVAVTLAILFFMAAIAMNVKRRNTTSLLLIRETFVAELSMHDSRGEYAEMLSKSQKMVELFPADLLAHWYLALGNYKSKQYGAALSALARIKEINASWSADVVDGLIDQIRSEMDGPRAHPS